MHKHHTYHVVSSFFWTAQCTEARKLKYAICTTLLRDRQIEKHKGIRMAETKMVGQNGYKIGSVIYNARNSLLFDM